MRSRYLIELTTPEVEQYFEKGGRTAILPVGCTEMHGPHQPIGTDTFVAKAIALKIAEKADGLVLPEINYTWAGATDGFKGTISIDTRLMQELVEAVALKAYKMGFTRTVVASFHAPNALNLYSSVTKLFAEHRVPVLFVSVFQPESEIFEGEYAKGREASIVLAAMAVLGMGGLYGVKEMAYEEKAPEYPEALRMLHKTGKIGYYMQDARQHACPTPYISMEKGLEYIEKQAARVADSLKYLDEYNEIIKAEKNKGTFLIDSI